MSKPSAWRNRIVGHGEEAPDQLLANPLNWRIHPAFQQKALQDVLDKVGLVQSVVVNKRTGHLVDGHLRAQLAMRNGDNKLPVVYVDLSEDDERLVLATMDPLSAMAGTDKDKLTALLGDLRDNGVDALLEQIKKEYKIPDVRSLEDVAPQIDQAEELRKKWKTKFGQLWKLGKHRLLCGDATNENGMKKLMDGRKPDLCLTDPPYGIGMQYGSFEDTPENVQRLISMFMPLILKIPVVLLTPGHQCLWDYPRPVWLLGWVHPAGMGANPWGFTQFNPVLVYGKDPYLSRGLGRRPDTLVLATDREGETAHPTSKPIKVWSWLLERGSPAVNEIVYDPFVGSGTTIIAAENLNRICYAMEIEPAYIAVTLQRWLDTTGEKPKRA